MTGLVTGDGVIGKNAGLDVGIDTGRGEEVGFGVIVEINTGTDEVVGDGVIVGTNTGTGEVDGDGVGATMGGVNVGIDVGTIEELGDAKNGVKFHLGPMYLHPSWPYSVLPGQSSSSPALFAGPFPHCISL